ncbi:MAG: hypothetical protein EOO77_11185 [Oxalobacteraceae bacterium]|nr:MAG: hypothetical protein EOO77_11185 [Oxalobacteraceae bacterium]
MDNPDYTDMPEITTEDRQALDAASKLAGANYGTRIYSAGALAALAIQRAAFQKRIAELEKRKPLFFWSNKAAIVSACGGLLLCIAGSASYVWVNRSGSDIPTKTLTEPQSSRRAVDTAPLATAPLLDTEKASSAIPETHTRTEQAVPPLKRLPKRRPTGDATRQSQTIVRSSPWIADPLQGEALRLALIEDRKRTRQLNDEQLQQR